MQSQGVYIVEGNATDGGRAEVTQKLESRSYSELRIRFEREALNEPAEPISGNIALDYADESGRFTTTNIELVDGEEVIIREPLRFIGILDAKTNAAGIFTLTGVHP